MNPACVYDVLKHVKTAKKGILKRELASVGKYTQTDICKTYDFLRAKGYTKWETGQLYLTPKGEKAYSNLDLKQQLKGLHSEYSDRSSMYLL